VVSKRKRNIGQSRGRGNAGEFQGQVTQPRLGKPREDEGIPVHETPEFFGVGCRQRG
jgi:hypothetical protein